MISTLAAMALASAPLAEPPTAPAPERANVVFAQPVATVLGLAVLRGLSVSGGASVRVNEEWSFTGDFAVLLFGLGGEGEDLRGTTSAAVSLGYTTRLRGKGLSGLFITPKVYGIYGSHWTDTGPSPILGTNGFTQWKTGEFGAGVDLALQWTNGALFIGTVLGAGIGVALGSGSLHSTFTGPILLRGGPGPFSPTIALNLHVFRIGYAF